jgi:nucleoside-diphosphate-sugar epimerase
MNDEKFVLLAGCGYVGSALAKTLTELGWNVDGIRRSNREDPKSYHPIYQDMTQPFTFSRRYSHIFYLASADSYGEKSYDQAYRLGLANLLNALSDWPKPELLVFVSSTSVYPQHEGEWVDEDSPVSHGGFARQAILAGEKLALERDIPSLVVRFSGIYGPDRMGFRDSILSRQRGLVKESFFTNRIHRDDCVSVLKHLMTRGKTGEIYLASDCEPSDYNEVVRWLCANAGVEPLVESPSHLPMSVHRGNKLCSNKKLLDSGYEFIHPTFRSGYR